MALTRNFLKAMGIEEEKVEQIIAAHADTVDALKEQRDKAQADADDAAKNLKKANEDLEAIKAKPQDDGYKQKYEDEHQAFEDFKATTAAKETKAKKAQLYREVLSTAGVSSKRIDAVMRVSDMDALEIGEDGKLTDADKLTENVKKEWAEFIETPGSTGSNPANPPQNVGGSSDNISLTAALAEKYNS